MCKITVLMSVYMETNTYLRQSIDSILNQTFSDFEFLIFDDATSNENKQLLQNYAKQDSRIRIIENEINMGLTYNLAQGVNLAKGVYIARMDSDDISIENRFTIQVQYMDSHPDVALLTTAVRFFGDINTYKRRNIIQSDYLKVTLLFNNTMPHPTAFMRNSFLKENNLNYNVDIRKSQDFELWARIAQKGKVAFLRQPLVNYRIHKGQISNDTAGEQRKYRDVTRIEELNNLGIILSKTEEKIYLEFCEGKAGKGIVKYSKLIKRIRKKIIETGQYNQFWLEYMFRLRMMRNLLN